MEGMLRRMIVPSGSVMNSALLGLRTGVAFLNVTFGFVLSVGFWGKALIRNATITLKKASTEAAV